MLTFSKDFYKFVTEDQIKNQPISSRKNFFFNAYALKWFLFLFFIIFQLIFFNLKNNNGSSVFNGDNYFKIFINVVFLAPILEEIVFRYHNDLRFKNLLFSILASITLFHDSLSVLFVILSYFLILLTLLKLNLKIKRLALVYISSFMFAILHVIFFESSDNIENLVFIFLPRFFGGLLFCYVFFKKGIALSILLHMFWNLFPFLVYFLRTQMVDF